MARVFIGFGSNLGDRRENISKALELIKERCSIVKVSSIYETEPVGYLDQGMFLNGVLEVESKLNCRELLEFLLSIEDELGRVRTIKDGPRTMDLDILFYGDSIIEEEDLIVPHPRLHERKFVLEPLNELDSEFIHPKLKKSIKELFSKVLYIS